MVTAKSQSLLNSTFHSQPLRREGFLGSLVSSCTFLGGAYGVHLTRRQMICTLSRFLSVVWYNRLYQLDACYGELNLRTKELKLTECLQKSQKEKYGQMVS